MGCHVSIVRDVRETVRQHRRRERFDLAERDRSPSESMPRDGRGLDAAAYGEVSHLLTALDAS
jgi:hypothetical protein